jgi:hypothetical protein
MLGIGSFGVRCARWKVALWLLPLGSDAGVCRLSARYDERRLGVVSESRCGELRSSAPLPPRLGHG